jgi:hypothetical protein
VALRDERTGLGNTVLRHLNPAYSGSTLLVCENADRALRAKRRPLVRHIMRLAASVSFALLIGSISLSAQNAGVPGMENLSGSSAPLPKTIAIAGCPISLSAKHGADGTMRKVDESRPEGIAQKLHLALTDKDPREIKEARLRVRGTSERGRVSRADMTQNGMDYSRNVTVKLQKSADNEASGEVWVPGMTAVLQVELSSVTFSDGQVQRFSASDGCRFTPDHLMLVAADNY